MCITSPEELRQLCDRLAEAEWVAVDTEFMREKTYYPQLCLIQLGTPEWSACVDPLALDDLGPLLDELYRDSLLKVFHACGQDLEIFVHLRGSVPCPVFDSQIAAPLLGYPQQAGYGALVEKMLGVQLGKAHSRADWSHRPLSAEQLEYALDDVRYLARLYPLLIEKLGERGRLDWLASELDALCRRERYLTEPADAWRRIKAARKLKPRQLAVCQALAAWREETARRENRPRNWLLRDEAMVDIARIQPADRDALSRIRGLHERVLGRHGKTLLNIVSESRDSQPEPWPNDIRTAPLSETQEALTDVLMAVVRLRAAEEDINPASVASRKDLQKLVSGHHDSLGGWRHDMVGGDLRALLDGDTALRIREGHLAFD